MKWQFHCFFLLFSYYNFCKNSSHAKVVGKVVVDNEVSILLSIKEKLIDPLDQLKDWTSPDNKIQHSSVHYKWTGVSCNSIGAVEKLDLSNKNLSGIVSSDIQKLQSLYFLDLCCNGFSSPLLKSFSNFNALKIIDLSQNSFVGSFPLGLGNVGLTALNASGNNFSGYLPEYLGNATFLESLDLRGNFFEGSIPKSFKNLGKLKFLESVVLGYNDLRGKIPAKFGNLTKLCMHIFTHKVLGAFH